MAQVTITKQGIQIAFDQNEKDRLIAVKNENGPQEGENAQDAKPRQIKAVKMLATEIGINAIDDLRHYVEGIADKQILNLQAEKARRAAIDQTDDNAL